MATTGDTLGGTAVSTTRSGSSVSWTTPSNALVNNTSMATVGGSFILSHWLHITNFDFSAIPDTATINGITIKIRRRVNQSSDDFFTQDIRLVDSGTLLGTMKNPGASYNYWTTTATIETHGGSSDLWGWTPLVATIKSPTFGFQFWIEDDASGSETAGVEVAWMNITYTPAAGGSVDVTKSMMMMF